MGFHFLSCVFARGIGIYLSVREGFRLLRVNVGRPQGAVLLILTYIHTYYLSMINIIMSDCAFFVCINEAFVAGGFLNGHV